jgi:hypothetical protein
MQALHLITHTEAEGDYYPLAGTGKCTIRQFKGKYQGMSVGDHVVMFHTHDPATVEIGGETIEFLQVSAYALGTLDMICTHHGPHDQHWRFYEDISAFQNHIRGYYPVQTMEIDGKEEAIDDSHQQYVAIYF